MSHWHVHEWERKQAIEILKKLNYKIDSEISVHEQFLERFKEQLSKPTMKKKGRKRLDRPNGFL
jgi:hypothetical protein